MIDINLDESIIDKLNSIGCTSFNLTPDEIKHIQSIDEDKIFEDIYQKVIETVGCPLLQEQQIYVSTADIRDTITSWKNLKPSPKQIKVKSEFYNTIIKVCPPITLSAEDVEGVRGLFIGIPIIVDDEIENDYEAVY